MGWFGLAIAYASALWWVLALVSAPGSIHYAVLPGRWREELLSGHGLLGDVTPETRDWWRLTKVEPNNKPSCR